MSTDEPTRTLLRRALKLISYDTTIEAGDDRILMQAAEADLRNGVLNENTLKGVEAARKWLGRPVLR